MTTRSCGMVSVSRGPNTSSHSPPKTMADVTPQRSQRPARRRSGRISATSSPGRAIYEMIFQTLAGWHRLLTRRCSDGLTPVAFYITIRTKSGAANPRHFHSSSVRRVVPVNPNLDPLMLNRRKFLGITLSAGAALTLSPELLGALRQAGGKLIERAIPSSGEKLPIIGVQFQN